MEEKMELKEFFIKGIILDPTNNVPIVLLEDVDLTMIIPIWIGYFEANAIALGLENLTSPRPLTHDLLTSILDELEVYVKKVVITDIVDSTYYANIYLERDGMEYVIDSRPSDALAISVKKGAKIYVTDDVIRKSSPIKLNETPGEEDDIKDWLDNLNPEDFGKYKM